MEHGSRLVMCMQGNALADSRYKHGQEDGGRTGYKGAISPGWRQRQQPLAQMHQPLGKAHKQQQRRLLVVVAAQASQDACQPRIVRACSHDACRAIVPASVIELCCTPQGVETYCLSRYGHGF